MWYIKDYWKSSLSFPKVTSLGLCDWPLFQTLVYYLITNIGLPVSVFHLVVPVKHTGNDEPVVGFSILKSLIWNLQKYYASCGYGWHQISEHQLEQMTAFSSLIIGEKNQTKIPVTRRNLVFSVRSEKDWWNYQQKISFSASSFYFLYIFTLPELSPLYITFPSLV